MQEKAAVVGVLIEQIQEAIPVEPQQQSVSPRPYGDGPGVVLDQACVAEEVPLLHQPLFDRSPAPEIVLQHLQGAGHHHIEGVRGVPFAEDLLAMADPIADEFRGAKVYAIWTTPGYPDYHWIAQSDLNQRFGAGFSTKLRQAILSWRSSNPEQKQILSLFGAQQFIAANASEYSRIEQVGRQIGKIR